MSKCGFLDRVCALFFSAVALFLLGVYLTQSWWVSDSATRTYMVVIAGVMLAIAAASERRRGAPLPDVVVPVAHEVVVTCLVSLYLLAEEIPWAVAAFWTHTPFATPSRFAFAGGARRAAMVAWLLLVVITVAGSAKE